MQITHKELPESRVQYQVEIEQTEVAEFFSQAVNNLAQTITVSGFRPGKAPADVVRGQIKPDALREEAYSLAARHAWNKIAEDSKYLPIEDPSVEVELFEEGKAGQLTFAFDIRPEVTLGKWEGIKIDDVKTEETTEQEVEDVLNSLARAHAQTLVKVGGAEMGDKVEVTFSGAINNIKIEKLSAKKFQLVLGQGSVVPGFEDAILNLKRGEEKKFSVKFPKDHFDKELAGKDAEFEIKIDEVFQLVLPARDDKFAEKFGHQTFEELKNAIEQDLDQHKEEEALIQHKAKWLAEFEKVVKTNVPVSLINTEISRSRQAWSQFLLERNLNAKDWLERRNTTMEQLESDWRKAAESSVKIGLGLSEVAKAQGKELKNDQDYQTLLDELVKSK